MDNHFCLKLISEAGPLPCYIDVPGSKCEEGVQVIGYHDLHGGDNQQWAWYNNQLTSLILYPAYSLAVKEIKDGMPVILHCKDNESNSDSFLNEWVFDNGVMKLKCDENFCIALSNDSIVLQNIHENNATQWEKVFIDCTAKPATSCHLNYQPVPSNLGDSWTLENTVCVRRSADSTYFCVVGWGPAGYCGIQQVDENQRVVIFSMWNDGDNNVSVKEFGHTVQISDFGGEGTGMKAIKVVNWRNDEEIMFRVSGTKCNKAPSTWTCSCWYSIENSDWVFIASYERPGQDLPFNQHFYAFIEDWDRGANQEGHKLTRMAEFTGATVTGHSGEVYNLKKALFTKQRHGADKFGTEKAFGGVKPAVGFMLSTGGDCTENMRNSLQAQYDQCTNEYLTELYI